MLHSPALVTACVASTLDSAQKLFTENPSASHFTETVAAMLAYQQWRAQSPQHKKELGDILMPMPICNWPDEIVKYATGGRTIAEIMSKGL